VTTQDPNDRERPAGDPLQHRGSEGSADDPREERDAPSNFVSVRQVLEKLVGLRGRLRAALERARDRSGSERLRLVLDGWVAEERRLASVTERHLRTADATDPDAAEGAGALDAYVQYADLETLEDAVAAIRQSEAASEPEDVLVHVERSHDLLQRALDQLAARSEIPSSGELFASLADLERGAARRRSSGANAALDV
jgi:hypothetical protein